MSVYLDIKSLYPHLKVNWNVLMCKICIVQCLVVDIFLWCNANFVPFPSGTLVARRMGNRSILLGSVTKGIALQKMYTINQRNENWIWPTSNSFCMIPSRIGLEKQTFVFGLLGHLLATNFLLMPYHYQAIHWRCQTSRCFRLQIFAFFFPPTNTCSFVEM